MGCFQRNWPVLSCIFVWSVAILRTTDGGSITWYEPPPFEEAITDDTIISATHKNLTKGFINEELSCNFSLTADLTIITVTIKFGGATVATYVRSPPGLTVVAGFASRFNATWIPTKMTLIVFNVTTADEGKYRCEVLTVGGGVVETWKRDIQVAVLVSPTVISENQTKTEGEDLISLCTAEGNPQPSITLIDLSNNSVVSGNFTSISREDAGGYRCTADNGVGSSVSKVVFIDVQYPPEGIQLHVSEKDFCNGTTISFICSAETANPMNLNYQLYENNTMIGVISSTGVWNKTMTVGGVFVYKCMVNNTVGTAMSSNVSVNVNVSSSIQTIPDKFVREGGNVTLFCNATGIPRPLVFWINVSNDLRTHGNELTIENITRYEAGEYRCEATNPCRNAMKSTAIVVHYPPIITSISSNQMVDEGEVVQLICTADGNPEPNITWTRLSDNSTVRMPLTITGKQDGGGYRCTADNGIGNSASSDVFITVKVPEKPSSASPNPTEQRTNQVRGELPVEEDETNVNQVLKDIGELLNKTCQNDTNCIGSEVTGWRPGSIIVSFVLYFKNPVTPSQGISKLKAAISDGKFGDYKVGELILLSPGITTSTTSRASKPTVKEGLPWTIIGAIAGSVLLVAFVVAFVTWWVHKKRKCRKDTKIHNSECEESLHGDSPNAKVNRAYAESGPPSASGTQQSQDLGAIPTYAVVDKSKKKKKKEEKPPIYATVDKSKKRKKKTDDKNLYDNVEEPKKERKPGEVLYAELGDFQNPAMPEVSTSPATLPPLRRPPSYEQTQYADITAFLKGDATLPQKEGNEGSEMQEQSANQSQHDVDNKETPM